MEAKFSHTEFQQKTSENRNELQPNLTMSHENEKQNGDLIS
jgi:hypothetical protein